MTMEEISYSENAGSLDEIYKKHRLHAESEMSSILSSTYSTPQGAFEDFVEEAEKKLMFNFDAFVSRSGHSLSSDLISISSSRKSKPQAADYMQLTQADDGYLRMIGERADKRIRIEIKEGEAKSLSIALANFRAPLVSKIEIILRKNAKLKLFAMFVSDQKKDSLNASSTSIVAEKGASAEINMLHNEDAYTYAMHFSSTSLDQDSHVSFNSAYVGSKSCIARNYASLRGERSSFSLSSSLAMSKEQKFDIFNSSSNSGAGSSYSGDAHVILSGSSLGFVKDMSGIAPNAKGANAYIKERAIVVGARARISMLPDMSINENDVKATHSAASAPIDEENLFYLMSKGISRSVAESMILEGFIADNLSKIQDPIARSIILSHLHEKVLSGEFGKVIETSSAGAWANASSSKEMFDGSSKYSGQEAEQASLSGI